MSSAIETLWEMGLLPSGVGFMFTEWAKSQRRQDDYEQACEQLAAVAVEQAEKLRRLENRDADADVLIATQKDIIAAEKARADGLQNRRDNLAHQFDNLVAQRRNLIESNKDLRRREEQERMLSGYANTELADMTVMWAEEKSRADEAEELLDTADDLLGRAIFAYGADENRYIAFLKRRSQEKP